MMFNKVMDRLLGWSDTFSRFLRAYANYFALGALLVMASKMFKVKINLGGK